jgi:hypothetical protein
MGGYFGAKYNPIGKIVPGSKYSTGGLLSILLFE